MLAGAAGLDREVRWVHSGEVPDIASMLAGGELLLSTGMGVARGAAAQRRFAADLAGRGVAAVVFELGPVLPQVPRPLVAAAEAEGLCLVALHREVRFVEITEAVHRRLIDQGDELRRWGEELHGRFTTLMLGGARIPDVLADLARFVRNPVILEKSGQGIAYHACFQAGDQTVLGAWGTYQRELATAPEAISERVPMGRDDSWGRLVALALDSPLEPRDRVAIERAVGLIALALVHDREEVELAARRRGDFLAGLPRTNVGGKELAARAAELGFSARRGPLLPVAMSVSSRRLDPIEETAHPVVRSDLAEELGRRAVPAIAGVGEQGESLFVLGLARERDRERIADVFAELARGAAARRLAEATPTIAVGAVCADWGKVGEALAETTAALPAAAALGQAGWHDASVPSTDRLLFELRDEPALRNFAERRLRPLIERDRNARGELLTTLTAYCEHGGRKTDTAAALQIKRQTLYHRLRRIEDSLGVDLSDGEARLAIHLALKARRQWRD